MKTEREQAARLGRAGEDKAAEYLKSTGYIIIKRNWRDSRFGEIDIVAESKTDMVFAEVRTRKHGAFISGAETVDAAKLSRVKNAAATFMTRLGSDLPFRVDVIEMTYFDDPSKQKNNKHWELNHIKNV